MSVKDRIVICDTMALILPPIINLKNRMILYEYSPKIRIRVGAGYKDINGAEAVPWHVHHNTDHDGNDFGYKKG